MIEENRGLGDIGNMLVYGNLDIRQYKIIFMLVGRHDLHKATEDYMDSFRHCIDEIRNRNDSAVIVLSPAVLTPTDEKTIRNIGHGRGIAMALFVHENIGFGFCRPGKILLEQNDPLAMYYNSNGNITDEGLGLIRAQLDEKLNDGTLFYLHKFLTTV